MARLSNLSSWCSGKAQKGTRGLVAALVGGTALLSSADADAYAIKRTSHGDLVHWEQGTVKYTIDPSVDRNVVGGSQATRDAMGSWSGTVGAPELEQAERLEGVSPVKAGFDKKNGVFFAPSGYQPAGRALAITVLTYDNTSGRILDADVIFNGAYTFEVLKTEADYVGNREGASNVAQTYSADIDEVDHEGDATTVITQENVYDLHHVIAHELGHSLGMNDEMGRRDALMYRYSAPNDPTMREPGSDDIAGLAELYSTKLEGRGNGCGSATVAPKAPSRTASHGATFAALGLLLFLALRARNDRRARAGFVFAAAAATIALVPSLSGGAKVARAGTNALRAGDRAGSAAVAVSHAKARVTSASTAIENGLFRTTYALATTECHAASCPKIGQGTSWGGTVGTITQEVGGAYAPAAGDDVEVSFAKLPDALGSLTRPLAMRTTDDPAVRTVTRAVR